MDLSSIPATALRHGRVNVCVYCEPVLTHYYRLHREALKQSATDPKTGIIDVSILTTGVSSSERLRRQLMAKELKTLLQVTTVYIHVHIVIF